MRSRDIVDLLTGRTWGTARWPRKRHALLKAAMRAADELCSRGLAEQKVEFRHGRFPVRFLRPIPAPPAEISPRTLSSKTKTCPPDRREQRSSAYFESNDLCAAIVPLQNLYSEGIRLGARPEGAAKEATPERPETRPGGITSGRRSKNEDLALLEDNGRRVQVAAIIKKPGEQHASAHKGKAT